MSLLPIQHNYMTDVWEFVLWLSPHNLFLVSTCPLPLFLLLSLFSLYLGLFVIFPTLPMFLPCFFFFLPLTFSFPLVYFCSCCAVFLFLSFLLLSRHCPSLNNYFLHCSSGLLFAGQSQVNCVCSLSICFCMCDSVLSNEGNIRSWQLKAHHKKLAFSLFFFFFSHPVLFSV